MLELEELPDHVDYVSIALQYPGLTDKKLKKWVKGYKESKHPEHYEDESCKVVEYS